MKIKISILLLVISLISIIGVFWFSLPKKPAVLRFVFDINEIEKIQIGKGGAADDPAAHLLVTLVKAKRIDEQDWRIPDLANASVDSTKVKHFLEQIRTAEGQLIAADPSIFSEFGIGNQEAFRVTLFNGNWKPVLSLFLGNKTDSLGYSFIREIGSNSVYQIESNLLASIGKPEDAKAERPTTDFWLAS